MSPPPRRLSFAVGTSLLTASLTLGVAGCDEDKPTVNPAPETDSKKEKPEEPTPNIGPEDGGEEPEPVHINSGPVKPDPKPEPDPDPGTKTNPGPEPKPKPEPKHVNPGPAPGSAEQGSGK
jgi:outer membrane biosynthesis protein TonB